MFEIVERTHLAIRSDGQTGLGEKRLLANWLLRRGENRSIPTNAGVAGSGLRSRRRNIFKLERNHAYRTREARHGIQIIVRRYHFDVGDLPGGSILIGRQGMDAVAHAPGGDCEHAAQLPAPQHANRGAWKNGSDHVNSSARTLWACSSRN